MVDAITTQVVRNRISSLMQEMHYHFYRSGYSTIIRESRDFSCVILDCRGGLIVAPPMFFHAPVYRHLVGKILQRYGDDVHAGRHVRLQSPLRGRPAARLRHGVRGADPLRRDAGRLRRLDRPQGRCRRHQSGLDLGQCHRNFSGRPAAAAGEDLFARRFQRATWSGSSSPTAASRNWCAATCMRRWRRRRWAPSASCKTCEQFGVAAVMEAFAALLQRRRRGIARRDQGAAGRRSRPPKVSWTMTASSSTGRCALPSRCASRTARSNSISATATGRRGGRSICARRWSRPACSTA